MSPENRKPPAGTGGISESNQLAGDQDNHTSDLAAVVAAAWDSLVGFLMSCPPTDLAVRLLDGLPGPAPDPVTNWWLTGARLAVEAGAVVNPLTASNAAITAGFPPPPALRGLVLADGCERISAVSVMPFESAQDLLPIVRDGHLRRRAQMAVAALDTAIWTADTRQLAEVWQREAGAVLALAAEVAR